MAWSAVVSEAREEAVRPSRIRPLLASFAPWIVPLVLLLLWEAAARFGLVTARLMPAPSTVALAGWKALLDGTLVHHTLISTQRALVGLLIGGGLGFLLGLLNGLWKPAETLLDSTLQMLRNIPHLALIPLVILWFGIDETAKIFLVAIGVFFPLYINTFHGVRTVDPQVIEMARVYGLDRAALIRRIILPGALPSILVGLRYSLGLMWLTLIVAETISANAGIGYMTMNAREFFMTDVVLLGIILYALLGKLADLATRLLERRLLRWHPAYQANHGDRN
ncbi:sulfonate transport system permease protein [Rhizobium sp. RU35A]|uniref:aliphatic sulfonate ABC transporter permease SsuC n=1 Tax=Rhizobium sp. RU35A TaxID=1907414 RepID=UPI000953A301|nr:aliphatic sulfonate ABC transporter permease SsuC [Rhizobium sp. RU35A]SIQ32374.1 sulfonate transport system permease protein [Rhizobium sp. RU35A]